MRTSVTGTSQAAKPEFLDQVWPDCFSLDCYSVRRAGSILDQGDGLVSRAAAAELAADRGFDLLETAAQAGVGVFVDGVAVVDRFLGDAEGSGDVGVVVAQDFHPRGEAGRLEVGAGWAVAGDFGDGDGEVAAVLDEGAVARFGLGDLLFLGRGCTR